MATPVRFGTEFLANTITLSAQTEPTVTALSDGRFVVCWSDQSGTDDGSATGVRAQIFNADGTVSGVSFPVNTTTSAHQNQPSITALRDGRFVASWTDQSATGDDTSGEAIRVRIFATSGTPLGGELIANTTTAFDQRNSSISALSDGRFVVCWNDPSDGTSGRGIRAQIFNADGSPSGIEFVVNSTRPFEQSDPSVVGLANGGFAVCWMDWSGTGGPGGDPSGKAIRAQVFDGQGAALNNAPDFVVNTTTAGDQFEPAITALANGGFVVSWTDGVLSSGTGSVRAQVFTATGAPSGSEFLVNTTLVGNQHDSAVAALDDGRFVFCWVDFSATGDDTVGSAIRAQVFNLDGSKSGDEFLVNTIALGHQVAPAVITLADGRFMVSWTDGSNSLGSVSDKDIRGQIFDPREAAIDLSGTALADQWIGTGFNDQMAGAAGNDMLRGEGGADQLDGGNGNDRLLGGAGADTIVGGLNNDQLIGDNGGDRLSGGLGRDRMTGGAGADDFVFGTALDAGLGAGRDTIVDFEHRVDDIDLRTVMATGSFIGNAAFENVAGQIRYIKSIGLLQGDVNGDGTADFEISIANRAVLTVADFIL